MEKYVINGGRPLYGEVTVSGAKNAAVAIIPAALLVNGVCRIENIPHISDTDKLLTILSQMGAKISFINNSTIEIDCSNVKYVDAPYELTRKIRASYYLIGAMLGRFGYAKTTMPGGCNFGVRPIEQHIKGISALGADMTVRNGYITAVAADGKLHGSKIYLDKVSVGATMNIILAAVLAQGRTIIENAAREPHIVDLANFLNSMGADVRGAGTDTIKINGVESLHGGFYSIIPDQIEAGTFMVAAAASGGEILIKNVIPKHLECISAKLRETGTIVLENEDSVMVKAPSGGLKKVNIKTLPYPGFPTDMQPQFSALLCMAQGTSVITEGIYDNRFKYVSELRKMGAEIQVDGRVSVVEGPHKLSGAEVYACDLRAGAAMTIAGICASGQTIINDIQFIERGYENFAGKLRDLGADIRIVDFPDDDASPDRIVYIS
ncbi:MAG: UDP-N-acetylglucosamine 1-carboxyvinyltransferase [Oscillospiraceae bacterium]|nr:UDP-N-acetylglucosamine 1-carboxyvinyltransferase [Oscillospiraceae bacterium]